MSSAGRGIRRGGPDDVYSTAPWCVDRLLEAWTPSGGLWLEPGAGSGAIIRAVNARRSDVTWHAVETRATCRPELEALGATVTIADFLAEDRPEWSACSVVIGNPPFHSAFEFVERSLAVAPDAEVCLLLRLAFMASESRCSFLRANPPSVYVLPNRPSFTPDGKTDSADYGWFVFGDVSRKFGPGGWGELRVLASTPKEQRRPAAARRRAA